VILNNGSDGAMSESWAFGAAAALERGWHAITFDGPGQNAALFRQQLHFRPDWEAVITPVVDFLVQRPEVEFTEAEGADWHCQPAAHALTTERVFNWLESILV
jgi:hypothetical protein